MKETIFNLCLRCFDCGCGGNVRNGGCGCGGHGKTVRTVYVYSYTGMVGPTGATGVTGATTYGIQ